MRVNQPVLSNVMGQSKAAARKYQAKADNAKDNVGNHDKDASKGDTLHPFATTDNAGGSLRITLQSANQDVDERAEVTVALNNPEEAVERMVKALAQRFPPESVLTIQPVGSDSKGHDTTLSSESHEATVPSTSDIFSSELNSARDVSYNEMDSRRGDRHSTPASSTAIILRQDPKTLRSLLRLASRGGDPREWARKYGMNPKIISKLVDDLVRDPDFNDWVNRLVSPNLSPSVKKKDHYLTPTGTRDHHSSRKATSQTGGRGDRRQNQPPAYPRGQGSGVYSSHYGDIGHTHSGSGHVDTRSYLSAPHDDHTRHNNPNVVSDPSLHEYYREAGQDVPTASLTQTISARSDELVPGFGEHVEVLEDGTRVRYVEVEVVQEKIIEVPKVEVREIERIEKVIEVREIEKIEEVEEIEWIEKHVEVDREEYTTKTVSVQQIIDRPKEVIVEKHVTIPRKVEKVVEIPEIIETPVPYDVEEKVSVPRYVNQETPTVVAQRLRPIVRESSSKTRVSARSYEPVVYTVDVFIPKPVDHALTSRGKIGEIHQMVEVPAAQYNTLLKNMNTSIPSDAIQDLFVRETGGNIPMLPIGEYDDIVAPSSNVTGILLKHRSSGHNANDSEGHHQHSKDVSHSRHRHSPKSRRHAGHERRHPSRSRHHRH